MDPQQKQPDLFHAVVELAGEIRSLAERISAIEDRFGGRGNQATV